MKQTKKRYILTLEINAWGDVVVEANSRKEAREKGEEMFDETYHWYEVATEEVTKIKLFNSKTHKHEYTVGTGECICGKINEEYNFRK